MSAEQEEAERLLRRLCDLWAAGAIGDAEFCQEAMGLLALRKRALAGGSGRWA
ncbi:MAG: hypothetical protein ACQXXL_03435 [Candidatus Methanosuratincola sp.]|jgi:hypothetical protein